MKLTRRLALAVAGIAVTASAVTATTPAEAHSNFGGVKNMRGARVEVDCSLGKTPHNDHTLYEKSTGKEYRSYGFKGCTDADAFRLRYDKRCVLVVDPTGAAHSFKADPDHWFKLPGLHTASAMAWSQCGSHAFWLGDFYKRLT